MIGAYFQPGPDGFGPHPEARGPWADDMLHGRLLGGLAARAFEAELIEPGWRAARLTVDLFRPAAMAPVTVRTQVVRQGRRIRVADAVMACGGHDVARATVVVLAESTEPPGRIWRPDPQPWPDPLTVAWEPDPSEPEPAWIVTPLPGGEFESAGQSRVWTRERAGLVEGEPLTPFVRAAMSGDLACPLANGSDEGLYYINGDYTLALGRYPVGEWIGLEASQQLAADGISIASSTLVDLGGPFATSTGTSLARPALPKP
ncbi:MAG: thioesterase family protein [Acidimicrobiales bacterium]